MNIFRKILLVLTEGPAIESYAMERKKAKEEEEREARRHHLNLCEKHQQEHNRSHYAEKNCHYCQLLAELERTK